MISMDGRGRVDEKMLEMRLVGSQDWRKLARLARDREVVLVTRSRGGDVLERVERAGDVVGELVYWGRLEAQGMPARRASLGRTEEECRLLREEFVALLQKR